MVKGALVLLGGDQGLVKYLTVTNYKCLRSTRHESAICYRGGIPRQTKLRFDRIGAEAEDLWIVADTSVERLKHILMISNPNC